MPGDGTGRTQGNHGVMFICQRAWLLIAATQTTVTQLLKMSTVGVAAWRPTQIKLALNPP
jgi:hypothetical protein